MALLDQLLTVNIVPQTPGLTRRGFGTPLIAAYHTHGPERVRVYTTPADLLADGFSVGDATYLAAQAIMSQVPSPAQFMVGRLAQTPATHTELLTPTAQNGTTYTLELADSDGIATTFEYTSDTDATAAEIVDALVAAVNADSALAITATDNSDGTLTLAADTAGQVFSLTATDNATGHLWARRNQTSDPGMATDLAEIEEANDTWFGLIVDNPSEAIVNAAASWAETHRKLLGFTTGDSAAKTSAPGMGDVLDDQAQANRAFTYGLYSERPHQYSAAALMGRMFPLDPGSGTWAYKTLRNTNASRLTATQRANIEGKNANWYLDVNGRAITYQGKTGLGDFIDVTRTVEWVKARIQEGLFEVLTGAPKVPFTDKGIAAVEAVIRAVWEEGIAHNALNDDLVVNVPRAVDVPLGDRANRLLSGVSFSGTVQGAIHRARILGTLGA